MGKASLLLERERERESCGQLPFPFWVRGWRKGARRWWRSRQWWPPALDLWVMVVTSSVGSVWGGGAQREGGEGWGGEGRNGGGQREGWEEREEREGGRACSVQGRIYAGEGKEGMEGARGWEGGDSREVGERERERDVQ
ncbi:hypothetical protein TIFTF001_006790 [Ficus carica]|uniref:Uncharacterized protein n=1 Tax=Ficus carica TaxID=3494 RepID=A0AA87ZNW7_FICCA|nr:hypothetical protein TIFTF001_006790 [Ficus carica]